MPGTTICYHKYQKIDVFNTKYNIYWNWSTCQKSLQMTLLSHSKFSHELEINKGEKHRKWMSTKKGWEPLLPSCCVYWQISTELWSWETLWWACAISPHVNMPDLSLAKFSGRFLSIYNGHGITLYYLPALLSQG